MKRRELKFRYHWIGGDESEAYPHYDIMGLYYVDGVLDAVNIDGDEWPVGEEGVVCRYIGRNDREGTEIHEGDIVCWGDLPGTSQETPVRYAEVRIDPDIQFVTHVPHKGGPYTFHYGTFAYRETEKFLLVVGNIYENRELLK